MDETFQAFMALHVGHMSSSGAEYYEKQGKAVVFGNKQRLEEIRRRMRRIKLVNEDGQAVGERTVIDWNSDVYDALIARLIKGLYWHHTRVILPAESRVEVQWPRAAPLDLIQGIPQHESDHAGLREIGDQFAYCFMIDPALSGHSIWLFQFHQVLWATGYTLPPGYIMGTEVPDPEIDNSGE